MPQVGFEPTITVFERVKAVSPCLRPRSHCNRQFHPLLTFITYFPGIHLLHSFPSGFPSEILLYVLTAYGISDTCPARRNPLDLTTITIRRQARLRA
jgi:hypothetical protein